MKSICKTKCRNLINGNRYGGLPKRFTRKNPRMVSIRGLFRRNGKEAIQTYDENKKEMR